MNAYQIYVQELADARAHLALAIKQMAAGTLRTDDGPFETTSRSLDQAHRDIVEIDRTLGRHSAGNVHKI
jgi:hypothetical protein